MRIHDFKQTEKRLDEFRLSSLVGDYGSAALKKGFGMAGGKTMKQQMAQDIFLKDFVGDAISALQTGIQGGLIDPSIMGMKTPRPPKAQVDPGAVKPDESPAPAPGPTPTPAPAPGPTPTPAPAPVAGEVTPAGGLPKSDTSMSTGKYKQQQQTTQNMNQYIQSASKTINATQDKAQKIALTKELVNYMADRKDSPEWGNGLATVQQIIKKGNVDPNFATAALGKMKAGQTMAEAWKIFYINKLIESVGLTWNELGLAVLKEHATKTYYIVETKYLKLNNIFESILNDAKSSAEGIESYLTRWFQQYMKGVNFNPQQTQAMIKAVADSYAKDKGKAALEKLGNTAYALSKGMVPAGAQDAVAKPGAQTQPQQGAQTQQPQQAQQGAQTQQAQQAQQGAQTQAQPAAQADQQMNSHQMSEKIKKDLIKLSQVDAKIYNELIRSLQAAPDKKEGPPAVQMQPQGFQDKVATNNPAAQKVAEAKRIVRKPK